MKTIKLLAIAVFMAVAVPTSAQTAEEIIENYLETIGGKDNLKAINGIITSGTVNIGNGMTLPIEMIQTNGKMMMKANFQGMNFYQGVYDGETLWNTNQMTMSAEKSTAEETANYALDMNDFPDAFLDYAEKGYKVELLGSETMDGADTFKIKLTKEPITVDGAEQESVSYYYFDKDNFVPIAIENEVKAGPMKGQSAITKLSDYQEVNGIYFPFAIEETVKGMPQGQAITIKEIKINPEIDESIFTFPEDK